MVGAPFLLCTLSECRFPNERRQPCLKQAGSMAPRVWSKAKTPTVRLWKPGLLAEAVADAQDGCNGLLSGEGAFRVERPVVAGHNAVDAAVIHKRLGPAEGTPVGEGGVFLPAVCHSQQLGGERQDFGRLGPLQVSVRLKAPLAYAADDAQSGTAADRLVGGVGKFHRGAVLEILADGRLLFQQLPD